MNLDFMSAGIIAVCPCVEVFCTSPLLMPSSPPDGFNFLSSQFEMVLILFDFFSFLDRRDAQVLELLDALPRHKNKKFWMSSGYFIHFNRAPRYIYM